MIELGISDNFLASLIDPSKLEKTLNYNRWHHKFNV